MKPTVSGIFRGNGKEARLSSVSARWVEPFSDKTGIELVFTEKEHSKDKNPGLSAAFGKFGSALIISLHEDGDIYGCQVVHSAHSKQGFSSIGQIEANDFTYEDGKVEGELTTNGELDTFGEKWEVKLKFVAPLGEIPKEFQVAAAKEPEKQAKPTESDSGDEDVDVEALMKSGGETAAAGGGELKAKDLALHCDRAWLQRNLWHRIGRSLCARPDRRCFRRRFGKPRMTDYALSRARERRTQMEQVDRKPPLRGLKQSSKYRQRKSRR